MDKRYAPETASGFGLPAPETRPGRGGPENGASKGKIKRGAPCAPFAASHVPALQLRFLRSALGLRDLLDLLQMALDDLVTLHHHLFQLRVLGRLRFQL